MAPKKDSAEDKLKKMIEASQAAASGAAGASSGASKAGRAKATFFQTLKIVNIVMMVLLVGILSWLASEVNSGRKLLQSSINAVNPKTINSPVNLQALLPTIQTVSYYLTAAQKRNIFRPYEESSNVNVVDVNNTNQTIARKTGHLKLVGISWLNTVDSASVMIEDTEKDITYFLQLGEKVGDVVVKTIYADSVALSYKDEEIIISYDKSQL